jgi:hypothetical protein
MIDLAHKTKNDWLVEDRGAETMTELFQQLLAGLLLFFYLLLGTRARGDGKRCGGEILLGDPLAR